MSFILEALKKSEHQRQRTIGPSLADVQMRAPREDKPWWAFALGALLLVNVAVLLFVLLRDDDARVVPSAGAATEQTAPQATQRAAPIAPAPAPETPRSQPNASSPAVRSLAEEASVRGFTPPSYPDEYPNLAAAANVPEGPPIVRSLEAPSQAPGTIAPNASLAPSEPAEVLPTVQSLIASGTNLPEMHLDIHVHSPNPAERFVFVNMRKYVEGQTLAEGPEIERITRDGVVLNYQGMRFLLPRQ